MILFQDRTIVCLSFVSPESLMQEKEAFKAVKFLQSYCKDKKLNFQKVYDEYKDFTYKYADNLQKDFDEQNNFQTNMRGIKLEAFIKHVMRLRGGQKNYKHLIVILMYLLDRLVIGYHGILMLIR